MAELGYTANISPQLAAVAEIVPIKRLVKHAMNPRQHRIEKIAQSLARYGQRKPVITDTFGTIVAGHGVAEAAELLGWDSIAVIREEFTDNGEALGFLYADNRSSDLSTYKRELLLAGLERLAEGPGITDTLFEVQELEDLREEFVPVAELPDTGTETDAADEDENLPAAEGKVSTGERLHEMPILLSQADYANVVAWVKALQKEWGLNGVTATVVYAIKYAAEHVAEHKGVEDEPPAAAGPVPVEEPAQSGDFPF